jgi:hypothetical protein
VDISLRREASNHLERIAFLERGFKSREVRGVEETYLGQKPKTFATGG